MSVKFRSWASGFFSGIALVHLIPFFIRHRLVIGEKMLTNQAALITSIICIVLAIAFFKWERNKK